MKAVRMLEKLEGEWATNDGGDNVVWHAWPAVGEVAVMPDQTADDLVASGRAVFAQEEKRAAPETRPAQEPVEIRQAPPAVKSRAPAAKPSASKAAGK